MYIIQNHIVDLVIDIWQVEKLVEYVEENCNKDKFWITEPKYGWPNSQYRDYIEKRTYLVKDEKAPESCRFNINEIKQKIVSKSD